MGMFIFDVRTASIIGIGRLSDRDKRSAIIREIYVPERAGDEWLSEFSRTHYLVDGSIGCRTLGDAQVAAAQMRERGYDGDIRTLSTSPINDRNLNMDGDQAHRRRQIIEEAQAILEEEII